MLNSTEPSVRAVVHNSTDECVPVRYCVVSQNPTLLVFPRCLVADTVRRIVTRTGWRFPATTEVQRMIRFMTVVVCLVLASTGLRAANKEEGRLQDAGVVIEEILAIDDNIPQDLLDKAECVIVIPSMLKVALGIGGSYGRGAMVCRTGLGYDGPWGAPAMYALDGGSFGLQLGGQATDLVLLVMNERGVKALLNNKVKLGGSASAAAGPKGRDVSASTDATMRAEILSYSRSRGLFAGVSLEGSTLRPDNEANRKLYKKELHARDIVLHQAVRAPSSAKQLLALLNGKSPRNRSQRS